MNAGFVAGTLVHTDRGLVPIQNLQVGDLVWSKSLKENTESLKAIQNVSTIQNAEIWKVEYLPSVGSEDEYLLFVGSDTYIWVNGDAEGYEGTKIGWTKADDEMQTSSSVNLIGVNIGVISHTTPTFNTHLKNVAFTVDTWDSTPELLIDFNANNQSYFMFDLFDQVYFAQNFPTMAQGTIYVDGDDIEESGYIYNNDFKFDKYPLVAKFIQNFIDGKSQQRQGFFTTTTYQLEIADNHNYFVGNLGVLVGDSTIQGNVE
ncbi:MULTISPECIES: hypothetical protein [unclassified Moraxella]|uniref:hypothetical protein n=1 Tax=unclassified Moraxella TaxID=2685852 RepID=UPI003AF79A75